jgi:hypothetical protein
MASAGRWGTLTARVVRGHRSVRPAYPTKLAVLREPELLNGHVPPPWVANRELAATSAATRGVPALRI